MTTTFEKLSSNKVKLHFVVEAEKFEAGLKKAYSKNVSRFAVPGFRKGKAPMKIIENFYGAGVFYSDAFDAIFPEIYQEAIKEHNFQPVDQPDLDFEQIEKGKDLIFSLEVFVRPDVTLGEYKNLGVEKKIDEVTEDDVSAEIERARDRAARFVEVTDRAAKLDDQVNIDYQGFCEDEAFEGGTANGYDLVLGSGSFIPGFEDQIVGKNIGDEFDVNVTFPEQYHAENLAGKPAVFKVKLNGIQEKEVPAVDEDFVKEASETANTVEEYRAEIRANLEKQAENRADMVFENEIMEKVIANASVDIPDAMIEDQVSDMMREMEMRMAYQGLRMEDYVKFSGQTMDQLRESAKPQAKERIMGQLVLDAVRVTENIEATDEDVDEELKPYAQQGKTVEEFKATLSAEDMQYFKNVAALKKTVEFLKNA